MLFRSHSHVFYPFPQVSSPFTPRSREYYSPPRPISYLYTSNFFASHKIDSCCDFDDMHVINNTQTIVPVVALIAKQLHFEPALDN